MKLRISSLALAVAGAFAYGQASAAPVDLDASSTAVVPAKYASEIANGSNLAVGASADLQAKATFGFTTPNAQVVYIRYDLDAGAKFVQAAPKLCLADSTAAGAATITAVSAPNAANANYVIFAVTPSTANVGILGTANVLFDPSNSSGACATASNTAATFANSGTAATNTINVASQATVNLRMRVYTDAIAAVNATSSTLKDVTNKYITFTKGVNVSSTGTGAVADVNATPNAYGKFLTVGTTNTTANTAALSNIAIAPVAGVALADGSAVTLAAMVNSFNVSVSGDFSGLMANGFGFSTLATGATSPLANVSTVANGTATSNNVTLAALAASPYLTFQTLANGSMAVAESTYAGTLTLNPNGNSYTFAPVTLNIGSITRNGVTLVAPLAQKRDAWIGRLALTNLGTSDRTFAITGITDVGNSVTLNSNLSTGTLKANSLTAIDLSQLMTFPGATTRATLKIVVNAPKEQITGAYQFGSSVTGNVTNHVLDYK